MSKGPVWGLITLTVGKATHRIGTTTLGPDDLRALLSHAEGAFSTSLPKPASSPADATPPRSSTAGRATWLTAFDDAWHATFQAHLNFGQAARELSPLVKEHGLELALAYFRNYLQQQEPRFASISHFGRTFAVWAPGRANGKGAGRGTIQAGRSLLERWQKDGTL